MKNIFTLICISAITYTTAHAMEQEETNVSTSELYSCRAPVAKETLREYYYIKKSDIKKLERKTWRKIVRNPENHKDALLSQELYSTYKDEEKKFWLQTKFGVLLYDESNKQKEVGTSWSTPIDKEISPKKALQLIYSLKLRHEESESEEMYFKSFFILSDEGINFLIQGYKEKDDAIRELSKQSKKQQQEIKKLSKSYEQQAAQIKSLQEMITKLDKRTSSLKSGWEDVDPSKITHA
jgi:hypothetical protein